MLFLITISATFLSGCHIQNETYRANHQDTWAKIKKRGTLNIGVDDSFVLSQWIFGAAMDSWLGMMLTCHGLSARFSGSRLIFNQLTGR